MRRLFGGTSRRKWLVSVVAAATMLVSAAVPALEDARDFKFSNISGMTIDQLYVSPTKTEAWGVDILGVDVLEDGGSGMVTFGNYDPAAGCMYDIRVVTADGVNYDSFEWDLCATTEVDFAGPNAEFLFYYR